MNRETALPGRSSNLVLMRHGTAASNEGQTFGGWEDVPLAPRGIEQARAAGRLLKRLDLRFDVSFTSVLRRAIWTQWHCLDAMDQPWVPTVTDWRLNERHYGGLQGMQKSDAVRFWGAEQVHEWRRGFRKRPPMLDPGEVRDSFGVPAYRGLARSQVPLGESLQDTEVRVRECWNEAILPRLVEGSNVLLFAHGNSIRALLMVLEGIGEHDISAVEVPNGEPYLYEVTDRGSRFVRHDIRMISTTPTHQETT